MRPPGSASTAEVAEVEAQKPEAFTSLKVDYAALFIIDFNLQLAEFLPKSSLHRPNQPVVSLIGVDQDHQIVCESRIFDHCRPVKQAASVDKVMILHAILAN